MKRIVGIIAAFGIIASAAPVFAQTDVPTKFYDMDPHLVDGSTKDAKILVVEGAKSAEFSKLLKIKKRSMLAKIRESAKSKALQ